MKNCTKTIGINGEPWMCEHDHARDDHWREKDDPRAGMHYVFWPGTKVVKFAWPDDASAPSWPSS